MTIIKQSISGDTASIFIGQPIGKDGITAKYFKAELKKVSDAKKLFIYTACPGGSFDDGMEIYWALGLHDAYKVSYIQGAAESMGSIIALSADETGIAVNSWMMLHDVYQGRRLEEANAQMVSIYSGKTGMSPADIKTMMSETTYLDSGDCVNAGFADYIMPAVPFENEASYAKYRTPPNHLACKYESFSEAKAKRSAQTTRIKMARMKNAALDISAQRELCAQYNITTQEFNLIMNQED